MPLLLNLYFVNLYSPEGPMRHETALKIQPTHLTLYESSKVLMSEQTGLQIDAEGLCKVMDHKS